MGGEANQALLRQLEDRHRHVEEVRRVCAHLKITVAMLAGVMYNVATVVEATVVCACFNRSNFD